MAKVQRDEIDWAALQSKVANLHAACIPFKIATEQDIERCKLSDMTFNMIPSDYIEEWRTGELIVVLDRDKRERLIDLAYILGFGSDDRYTAVRYKGETRPRWERMDQLIQSRVMNDEFLDLWGLLNLYYAVYVELYLGNKEIYKREFHQCMMAQGDATLIQRHWYAHWLHKAKTKRSISLDEARSELIHLIESVREGKRKPSAPYDVGWYVSMLETKKRAGSSIPNYTGDLKTSYTRQTWAEIGRLVKHPLITRHVLPPLSVNGFEPA